VSVDARDDARAETTIVAITVRVERNVRGQWLVAVPDRERIVCQTLDEFSAKTTEDEMLAAA